MKLKCRPEDFTVEERLAVSLSSSGEYEVYLLTKRGTNTIDALKDMAKRLGIPPSSIGYCGLKDRHSVARQFVSVPAGAGREIRAKNYSTTFAGYLPHPLSPSCLLENRFEIVVRDVATCRELIAKEMEEVGQIGVPNYYDSQRFGSARHGAGFVALEVMKKNYKRALRLLLAEHSSFDPSTIKRLKRCIRENWGNFEECIELAKEGWLKRILEFLSKREFSRTTAKRALGMVDEFTKSILISALQSYIWNLAVEEMVESTVEKRHIIKIPVFDRRLPFYRGIDWIPPCLELPTPSPRLKLSPEVEGFYTAALKRMGLSGVEEMRTSVKGWLLKSHRRRVKLIPKVEYSVEDDPERPGKSLWRLSFSLPSGSYATLVIKRIFWRELV